MRLTIMLTTLLWKDQMFASMDINMQGLIRKGQVMDVSYRVGLKVTLLLEFAEE